MNEAPGGDHLRMTLLQVVTENKRFTKEKGRQKSADQPRDCSDPTYLEHPSIVAHECQYTKDKNLTTWAPRLLQKDTITEDTVQPDTAVTLTNSVSRRRFLSRSPR